MRALGVGLVMDKKKLLIAIAYVAVPVFLAWVGAAAYVYDPAHIFRNHAASTSTAYYDLPQMRLTSSSGTGHTGMMKVDISIEVPLKDLWRVADYEPRIVEKILTRIRKTKYDDIRDRAGWKDFRDTLRKDIDDGAMPMQIVSVAIRELVFE